jgi:hypothetical protein
MDNTLKPVSYIEQMKGRYETGVKVLSMKINYPAPFKHKHKYQMLAHEN